MIQCVPIMGKTQPEPVDQSSLYVKSYWWVNFQSGGNVVSHRLGGVIMGCPNTFDA